LLASGTNTLNYLRMMIKWGVDSIEKIPKRC